MKLTGMAGWEDSPERNACLDALDPAAPADYRELAAMLAVEWLGTRPRWVGLGGGQGAGKTTLGKLIEAACAQVGLRACVLGIDDFYKTKAERLRLAEEVHPLLETRGPPGTHDLALCRGAMEALGKKGVYRAPRFDKGLDDRAGYRELNGPFNLIVLEGWCVGGRAVPVSRLSSPINELERLEDGGRVWRGYVNDRLAAEYEPLWDELDETVFLEVPDLEAVRRWRLQQEQGLPENQRFSESDVNRFIEHYERVTAEMLDRMPRVADWHVRLAPDHTVADLCIRRSSRGPTAIGAEGVEDHGE